MAKQPSRRRPSIIATAQQIIDEMGLWGLTMREIARRQDISEPAVYRHFASKEEILLAVLEKYAVLDEEIHKCLGTMQAGFRESVLFLVQSYVDLYQKNTPVPEMIMQDKGVATESELYQKSLAIIDTRFRLFHEEVARGLNGQATPAGISSEHLTNMIIGLIQISVLRWRTSGGSFDLQDYIKGAVNQLLDTLIRERKV